MRRNTNAGLDRRQFISGVTAGVATLGSTGVAVAGCKDHDAPDLDEVADGKSEKTYYCLQKRWFFEKKFLKLTPLKGSIPVEELYGWDRTHYSSTGTKPLQRENTCTTFLYEGPDGDVSLVIVHEKWTGDNDGGSASFEFLGLPEDGSWIVRDDDYDAPSNYDQWETDGKRQTVHWTWAGGRNDGGAYGPLDDDLYFRIDPSFNEDAELYGEEYEGEVEKWQVLSGRLDDPERHTLWMDEGANFFKGIFSDRDHEDYWEEKRDEWEDGDEKDDREEDGGKDHDDEKGDDEKGHDEKDNDEHDDEDEHDDGDRHDEKGHEDDEEHDDGNRGNGKKKGGDRGRGNDDKKDEGKGHGRDGGKHGDEDHDDEDEKGDDDHDWWEDDEDEKADDDDDWWD